MGLQPVESVQFNSASSMSNVAASGGGATVSAQTATQSMTSVSTTSTTTAQSVDARVGEFLESFGSEIQSDQQLRMIIGLLILQALLSGDRKEGDVQGGEMNIAAMMADMLANKQDAGIISQTNIVQIQQQSSLVVTDQAVQTLAGDGSSVGGEDSPGSRLDVTG